MKVSLFFVRIHIFTCFATVLRTADFVALEKTTTLEAHKLQPFHPLLPVSILLTLFIISQNLQ